MVAKAVSPIVMENKLIRVGDFLTHLLSGAAIGLVTGGVTLAVTLFLKQ